MPWLMEILKIYREKQLLIKLLRNKAFNITKIPQFNEYQRGLDLKVYMFFDK